MFRVVTGVVAAMGLLSSAFDASAGEVFVDYYYDRPYETEIVIIERNRDDFDDVPYETEYFAVPDYGRIYGRPASCGEYHYWDGVGCVDARDTTPYLGPKW